MSDTLLKCMEAAKQEGTKSDGAGDFDNVLPHVGNIYGESIKGEIAKVKWDDIKELKQAKSSVSGYFKQCEVSVAAVLAKAAANWEGICKNYRDTHDKLALKYKNFDENRADDAPVKNTAIKSFAIIMFFFIIEGLIGSFFLQDTFQGGQTKAAMVGMAVSLINVGILGTLAAHIFVHFRKRSGDINKLWFMLFMFLVVAANASFCYWRYTEVATLDISQVIFLVMFCVISVSGFAVSFWFRYNSWKPEDELYDLRRRIHRTPMKWEGEINDAVEDACGKIIARKRFINKLDVDIRNKFYSMRGGCANLKTEYTSVLLKAIKGSFVAGFNAKGLQTIKSDDLNECKLDDWDSVSLGCDDFTGEVRGALEWWDSTANNDFDEMCDAEESKTRGSKVGWLAKLAAQIAASKNKYNIHAEAYDV